MIATWPSSRLAAAIDALAATEHIKPSGVEPCPTMVSSCNREDMDRCLEAVAAGYGLEAEATTVSYHEFTRFVRTGGPALISPNEGGIIAVDSRGRLIGPDLKPHRIAAAALRSAVFGAAEQSARDDADRLLRGGPVRPGRGTRAREVIVREWLSGTATCWQLRVPPAGSFLSHLRTARLVRLVTGLALAHATEYAIWIVAWWMVGRGALTGSLDRGWLGGWALLLLTVVPLRLAVTALQGQIAIRAGGLFKERMLYGALRLEPDDMRRDGAGRFLGRVIETESMESLALGGGFLALVSTVELIAAAAVAVFGVGSLLIPALLATWIAIAACLLLQLFRRCSQWTATRLSMTDDLVERMAGHRTRLAQEPHERWHEAEDGALENYHATSGRMDRSAPSLVAWLPRGWLITGLAALAPEFIAGSASPESLAVQLGAIVLAFRGLKKLGGGAPQLFQAFIAWKQAQPFFEAAARSEPCGAPSLAVRSDRPRPGEVLLEARDVIFQYRDRQEPVLRGCGFQIRAGDRILLDGPSGEGKSTLAAIIAGVRTPTSGLVLASGLDRTTIGACGWRRRVAVAPQFHENHLIAGPLAFNLLMGRAGRIADADVQEAETICEELGLGGLLRRMPAGMMQMVGENGWQLSHGERSRVYLARALLQRPDVVVLDESLAALDAASLARAIACLEKRATAVLAIAHQ